MRASNGSVVIRPRHTGLLLVIGLFSSIVVGLGIMLFSSFISTINEQRNLDLPNLIEAIFLIAVLTSGIIYAVRSLQKTTLTFDVDERSLLITERGKTQQIKFSDIEKLIFESTDAKNLCKISILLNNQKEIKLGSASGTGAKKRGEVIAKAICFACGTSLIHQDLAE